MKDSAHRQEEEGKGRGERREEREGRDKGQTLRKLRLYSALILFYGEGVGI